MNPLYTVSERRCHQCSRRKNEHMHFRTCVPKRYWPQEAQPYKAPDAPNQTIYLDDVCECGYEAKSEQAMRMHKSRAKVHKNG